MSLPNYSHRLAWTVSRNALTKLIEQKKNSGAPLLNLTVSNPSEIFDDYPYAAIGKALAQSGDLAYCPHPLGEEQARAAVVGFYAARGIHISPERLALTASTSEAYAMLFKLLCDPGDEILVPLPSYPLFEYLAALESIRVSFYHLSYDGGWFIHFDSLRQAVGERTRAIVLVNPNNPTGSFLTRSEAGELFGIAAERGLPLISDEVFMNYALAPDAKRVCSLIGSDSVLSFSLNGLSKSAAMPQMKLAWIAMNGPEQNVIVARERLELILDTFLSVSTPVQKALPQLFAIGAGLRDQVLVRVKANLQTLRDLLRGSAAQLLPVDGGWSAIIQVPQTLSEDTWAANLLHEHNVIVQPGYFFDMPSEAYLVVSLITRPEIFREGVMRLCQAVSQYA